jgi:predicted permease
MAGLCNASPGNVEDFRRASGTLADIGIGRTWLYALTGDHGSTGVNGGIATAGFFRALGVTTESGRLFTDDEVGPDRDRVVLLSHAFWTSRFGADPSVLGSVIHLDGDPYQVVGVLEQGFDAPFDMRDVALWKPPHFDPLDPEVRGWRGFRAIGRLADGADLAAASSELAAVYAGIAREHADVDETWRLRVEPLLRVVVGDTRPVLLAFLAGAGLLLMIVCANVANLVLARGMDRSRELAVRAALGGGRRRLIQDIMLESLLLAGAATVLAVGLGTVLTHVLVALAPPEIPRLNQVAMDGRVLGVMAVLSVLVTLVFALVPAARVTAGDLAGSLRSGVRAGTPRGATRLRAGLVVAEVALAVMLVTTAGVLTRSFTAYLDWDPGFDRGSLLAVSAFLDTSKYPDRAAVVEFYRAAEGRLAGVPGVTAASSASAGPLFGGGDGATPFTTDGLVDVTALPSARWYDVGPGHFATLGVAVTAGRELEETDASGSPRVAVVNEALARMAWPDGGSPVGRMIRLPELDLAFEVVGVVADVSPLTPGARAAPEVYWSNRQLARPATFFLVRTAGDPTAVAGSVTSALLQVDPDLSLGTPRTLVSTEARALVRPRFQALVLTGLGLAALALSWVGVYAVVSYAVAQRIREMGIRMALGAGRGNVLALVLRSTLVTASGGVVLGLIGSFWAAGFLRGMVAGVNPVDPVSLAGAGLLLMAAAAAAAIVPARRAMRVDPLEAMRAD